MEISLLPGRRLKTRLIFWTAVIVTVAVAGSFEVRTRLTAARLETEMVDRAQALATRAADLSGEPLETSSLEARLRDFVDPDPSISRIDLLRETPEGPRLIISTSDSQDPAVDPLPNVREIWTRRSGNVRELITAEPVPRTDDWIVIVTSLEGLDRYVAVNRAIAAAFGVGLIVVVILLMNMLFDRLLSRRFDQLLAGLRRADANQDFARLQVGPDDEIGVIARTLKHLLERVQVLNEDLQGKVDKATESLNSQNQRLRETSRQLLEMQRQLLRSERLATVGQTAATFAHEIGSPLSSLSAHVQLLLEEPGLGSNERNTLLLIQDQIHSVTEIVSELLRTARRGPEDFGPVDMTEVLDQVNKLVEPRLKSQGIEVSVSLDPVPQVRGYRLYLQEAVLNLVNNAFEAMPRGGQLDLGTSYDTQSNSVQVRIADTGPGIDSKIVENAFRGKVTAREMVNGGGLGLAIVHEIVLNHNGSIEISNRNGRGTLALMSFPAAVAYDPEARRASDPRR